MHLSENNITNFKTKVFYLDTTSENTSMFFYQMVILTPQVRVVAPHLLLYHFFSAKRPSGAIKLAYGYVKLGEKKSLILFSSFDSFPLVILVCCFVARSAVGHSNELTTTFFQCACLTREVVRACSLV